MQRNDIQALLQEAKKHVKEQEADRDAKAQAFQKIVNERGNEAQVMKDDLESFKGEKEALAQLNLPKKEHDQEVRDIDAREEEATAAADKFASVVQAESKKAREVLNEAILAVKVATGQVAFFQRMLDRQNGVTVKTVRVLKARAR